MSHYILQDIRQALGLSAGDDSLDEEIMGYSPDHQFELYCQWNGLLGGWADLLSGVVLELFKDQQ